MKNLLLASAMVFATSSAFAGGLTEPVYEPTVMAPTIIEEAAIESANDDQWVGVFMTFLTIVVLGLGV